MSIPSLETGYDRRPPSSAPQGPKLLERLRMLLEARRYRPDTVGRFVEWNRQYILFQNKRHPQTMGRQEIEQFLRHLAEVGYGMELQAQARQALAFLYRELLGQALPWPEIARLRGQGAAGVEDAAGVGQGSGKPKLLERPQKPVRQPA